MNDTLVKLHINEDVKPIQQKPRPVPFNVRDDADKELERLESLDIIEKSYWSYTMDQSSSDCTQTSWSPHMHR